MNAANNSGLQSMFARLKANPVETAIPDVPEMIVEAKRKARHLSRLDDLVFIDSFISTASRLECKHIINMLIDRVVYLDGLAPELEDAACSLTRSIEADGDAGDAADSMRACMEGRGEE